jgi:hypothetical protein
VCVLLAGRSSEEDIVLRLFFFTTNPQAIDKASKAVDKGVDKASKAASDAEVRLSGSVWCPLICRVRARARQRVAR